MGDSSSVTDYLYRKLGERRNQIAETVARGNLKDFAEYRHLCGLIQGLEFAENLTLDLAKRLSEDAEDEG